MTTHWERKAAELQAELREYAPELTVIAEGDFIIADGRIPEDPVAAFMLGLGLHGDEIVTVKDDGSFHVEWEDDDY